MSQTTTTTDTTDEATTNNTQDALEAYHRLHGFKRDILHAIHAVQVDPTESASYGLAIKRRLESWHGQDVNHGRLYPNLDDLVRKDYVAKSALDRRTNEYTLTEEGRELVAAAAGHHEYDERVGGGE